MEKPLRFLRTELKSPPLSRRARIELGQYLRQIQQGQLLPMPYSRPMPSIDPRCHELRVRDGVSGKSWRLIYAIENHEVVVLDLFGKQTGKTPLKAIERCRVRLREYRDDH